MRGKLSVASTVGHRHCAARSWKKFREQYGQKQLASLPEEFIVALLDTMTPRVSRNWLVCFRHFIRWCKSRKLIRHDPTANIKIKTTKSTGHHT
jgi:hypothetical protein